jgi:hypothetical protein
VEVGDTTLALVSHSVRLRINRLIRAIRVISVLDDWASWRREESYDSVHIP